MRDIWNLNVDVERGDSHYDRRTQIPMGQADVYVYASTYP